MGVCFSHDDPAAVKSRTIDRDFKKTTNEQSKQVKVLLLGPGESGKSTIFKQMRLIQVNGGFEREQLTAFIPIVRSNCLTQMRVLVEAMPKLNLNYKSNEARAISERLLQCDDAFNEDMAGWIKMLWSDEGILEAYANRGKSFLLNDTASYFFENVERICSTDYLPSKDDVLRARVRSNGIEEAVFPFEDLTFLMVDVGGQRSERRKWIHCFSNVTAILFVAGLSDYTHSLREDSSQNTMAEALLLFDEVANSSLFDKEVQLILFLNKIDLFAENIKIHPLNDCFPDYTGPNENEAALDFVHHKFVERSSRKTSVHRTCALNTDNVRFVITAVRKMLLEIVLQQSGINF